MKWLQINTLAINDFTRTHTISESEQYNDSPLYQKLCETKPEYGSNRRIQVKLVDGEIAITNVHVGSMGDIILG